MTKLALAVGILVPALAITGCGKSSGTTPQVVTLGMQFHDARLVLERHGLKEDPDAAWDMVTAPGTEYHTFDLDRSRALLLFEDTSDGRVRSMTIYKNVDQPKASRDWQVITTFNVMTKS